MTTETMRYRTMSMTKTLLVSMIVGLSLVGAVAAQEEAKRQLPPDIDPVSLTRLPPLLTRSPSGGSMPDGPFLSPPATPKQENHPQ